MSRCPIVKPDVVRVPLAHGDFIDLKRELNTGEYREMLADQYKESSDPERTAVVNLRRVGLSRVMAYLMGWSFVDLDGKPLLVSEGAVKACEVATFREILQAVDAHHEASEKEQDARKNALDGGTVSSPTLPSAA